MLSLHFADHRNVRPYFDAITRGQSTGLISAINLAEFYKACQKLGKQTADTWHFQLRETELRIVEVEELIRLAGIEKCRDSSTLALRLLRLGACKGRERVAANN